MMDFMYARKTPTEKPAYVLADLMASLLRITSTHSYQPGCNPTACYETQLYQETHGSPYVS